MNSELKFIADASLSGLAKWLRILGYDTVIYSSEPGRLMMRQAKEGDRIILTRRADMVKRQYSGRILLLSENAKLKQLAHIVCAVPLKIHPEKLFSVCLSCNEKLLPIMREEARESTTEYVYENCLSFNRCPKCLKIYWQGTHGQNVLRRLKDYEII